MPDTPDTNDSSFYPDELAKKERELIEARRACHAPRPEGPPIGIACSGGGIRSATSCLGFFQALARAGLLSRVDYISTISGGGYFGSFLGSLFQHHARRAGAKSASDTQEAVAAELTGTGSGAIAWLRKHGRYIAPDGAADYVNIAAVYCRNWVGVHYVLGVTLLMVFFFMLALRGLGRYYWPCYAAFDDWVASISSEEMWFWSPWVIFPIVGAYVFLIPLAISFWLTQYGVTPDGVEERFDHKRVPVLIQLRANYVIWGALFLLVVAVLLLVARVRGMVVLDSLELGTVYAVIGAIVLGIAFFALAEVAVSLSERKEGTQDGRVSIRLRQARVRNRVSDWLATALKACVAFAAIALVDTLAQTLYMYWADAKLSVGVASAVSAALLWLVHRAAPLLQQAFKARSKLSLWTIADVAGMLVLLLITVGWSFLAYVLAFRAGPFAWSVEVGKAQVPVVLWTAGLYFIVLLNINLLTGRTPLFVNLSSLQAFYSARLRRAYLGAANPERTEPKATTDGARAQEFNLKTSIRLDVSGDDTMWPQYRPHEAGGPLHLIGVTVNHTVAGGSDIELRDRKGFTMCFGPAGASAQPTSHALWEGESLRPLACPEGQTPVFGDPRDGARPVETLSLSRLVAISGAAFSTGLGARTRKGLSVLLAMANVRLGYWWASGGADVKPRLLRTIFRTQFYLLGEFLARFPGASQKHWYFSDGGHSENTGAYELVRRRLPVIVILDNGADLNYQFEDFANLMRRIRIDFGAETCALDAASIASLVPDLADVAGDLATLVPKAASADDLRLAKRNVALFRVDHRHGGVSLIVLVKPALTGSEPEDIVNYARQHPAFPQEPTSDQFFDEAQWESYRRLGEHVGARLFARYRFGSLKSP
jgi:hypothetical protein